MLPGRRVTAVETSPDGRLAAVVDDTGQRHDCQVAVKAVGVEPRVDFLAGSSVKCQAGVLVDERMRTSAADVWAAGDCAEIAFPDEPGTGVQKLWSIAQPRGWVAGNRVEALRLVPEKGTVVGASFVGTALTKEDLAHMVESRMAVEAARAAAGPVLGRRARDRAPVSRLAAPVRLSRRPAFWPFGPRRTWRNCELNHGLTPCASSQPSQ